MLKIIITVAAMTLLLLADGPVLQTGQTLSYDTDGNIVPYGSIRDDGYYRAGKARSYGRSGNVVKDNATGLEWQDNESVTRPWYDPPTESAETYCVNLPLDSGGWHLPTIQELLTVVDYSQREPSATEGIFNHISSSYYWSSTAHATYAIYAWTVRFDNGNLRYRTKDNSLYVRCVRGEPLAPSNLSRNDTSEIVTDSATGLEWQDDNTVKTTTRSWTEAIDYCENTLTLGDHSDWRMPNKNELLSIVNFYWHDPALNTCRFQNYISSSYWSSTTDASNANYAWIVDFKNGYSEDRWKRDSYYVRCVRGGQVNIPVNPAIIMYLLN